MKDDGFTLVELLAVIAILGLILTISIPIVGNYLQSSKEKSFFISAKSILREVEYVDIDESNYEKISLDNFNLKNISNQEYDLNNSYIYMSDGTLYLDLVGIGKFDGYYLCAVTSTSKTYIIQSDSCEEIN